MAVKYIDGYLQQNYSQAQITKQLEVACALAPAPLRPQCDAFVDYYAPLKVEATEELCVFCTAVSTLAAGLKQDPPDEVEPLLGPVRD